MKYRTTSADVLNEADRFQRIMDWQLFVSAQEQLLFGYNPDVDWTPGDPIYTHPKERNSLEYMVAHPEEWEPMNYWEDEGPLGNCARPIMQTVEYYEDDLEGFTGNHLERVNHWPRMKCDPCGVSWGAGEDTCWVCGTEYPTPKFGVQKAQLFIPQRGGREAIGRILSSELSEDGLHVTFQLDMTPWQEAFMRVAERFGEFTVQMNRQASLMGQHLHYFMMDEMRHYSIADTQVTRQLWEGGCNYRFEPSPPARNPFEIVEREIEVVPPVVPNLPAAPSWSRVELPPNLDLSGRVEPERPQMREVQLPEVYDPYWVRMGPSDPWRNR